MTIKITVSNDDESREVEVEYADPIDPSLGRSLTGGTVLGPKATGEFWVHGTQAVVVREVAA